ncbi:MAG: phosphatidylserine decarboxylase [Planctomycetota bacterium]|nr:phosphatidylserine decarboxylase [Planctomycetota bacterium]MDA1138540.1 phosphatidylserine decarboxylase [Planctomycetota bacterium]
MTVILIITFILVTGAALLSLFFRNFHRDPDRIPPEGPFILSPADGKVLDVIELPAGEPVDLPKGIIGRVKAFTDDLADEPHIMIPIFMNPFNVHVQWAPLDGKVLNIEKREGKFVAAYSIQALENATIEMLVDTRIGKVKLLQTAGYLVRHIHNWLAVGEDLKVGNRWGKMDFGSQVTIIVPKKAVGEIKVKKDDIVQAGETVLATISNT